MSLYRPSDLLRYLQSIGVDPKKGLSQNFLIDGNIIRKIVKLADIQPDDYIVEIGSGPGALSEAIVETGAHLIAIEMDALLAKGLERLKNCTIYQADILSFPLHETLLKALPPGKKAKVVANLPYHITSPIMAKLLPLYDCLSAITVMVQEEVARRMVAPAKTKEYGHFSLFLSFFSKAEYGFKVSNRCFFPPPKVESAVVQLLINQPLLENGENFFSFTRAIFNQKRKMITSSLKDHYKKEEVVATLEEMGFLATARPQDLSVLNFLSLYKKLGIFAPNGKRDTKLGK